MSCHLKKFVLLIATLLVPFALAAEPQGKFAQVELLSGTRQKAQFLGIVNDTVSLGGYIKNQFTIVKFPKSQFKSIVDEEGNDLLNAAPDSAATATDTAKAADASAAQGESAVTAQNDSTNAADTNAADVNSADTSNAESNVAQPARPKIFVGFESDGLDTNKRNLVESITFGLLREIDSHFEFHKPEEAEGCNDRNCIQEHWKSLGSNEIYFGKMGRAKHPDSVTVELTRVFYEDSLPTVNKSQMTVSLDSLLQDAIKGGAITNLAKKATGRPVPTKRLRSYVHVETDPESATISRPEKDAICKSPCTFSVSDTGKIELNAYWSVDKHLWGAQTFVHPTPGDTAKVSLKLKRITPEIKIVSNPVGAEIFPGSGEITHGSSPIGTTPKMVSLTTPGMTYLRLRKAGYRDTLVSFYVAPVSEINLDISMEHHTDFEEIKKQEEWFHERRMSYIGKVLMGSSVAPALVGALFLYLAQQDYDEAEDIKGNLKMPSAAKGENFTEKVDKNKDLVKSGDRKTIIGGSLIGGGLAVFGLGLFLTF